MIRHRGQVKIQISCIVYIPSVSLSVSKTVNAGGDDVSESKEESKQTVSLEKVEGVWEGSINVPNQPLPITVEFIKEDGNISIKINNPEKQNVFFITNYYNTKI